MDDIRRAAFAVELAIEAPTSINIPPVREWKATMAGRPQRRHLPSRRFNRMRMYTMELNMAAEFSVASTLGRTADLEGQPTKPRRVTSPMRFMIGFICRASRLHSRQ